MKKRFLAALALCAVCLTACSQNKQAASDDPNEPSLIEEGSTFPQMTPMTEGEEIAVITTNFGDIKIRFFPQEAPTAVENFITHAKNGYYNDVLFHRVIEGFMIQSGDPLGTGTGGESIWGEPFIDEIKPALRHFRGALSMAKPANSVDSNGSQFFIVQNKDLGEDLTEALDAMTAEIKEHPDQDEVLGVLPDGTEVKFSEYFPDEVINKYKSVGGTPSLDFEHTVFGQVYEGMGVVDKIAAAKTDASDKPEEKIFIKSIRIEPYKK